MTEKHKLHLFKNKWLNECYKCHKVIEIGEYVWWHHETKKVKHHDQSICYYKDAKNVNIQDVPLHLLERALENGMPKKWQLVSMGVPFPPPQGWKKAIKKEYLRRMALEESND